MANSDIRFGLRPVRHQNGAPYNNAVTPYLIPSTYGTALFVGDPVVITGTANTAEVTVPGVGVKQAGTLPAINKATAGDANAITGAIVAFAADPTNLSRVHNPASTERVAFVADDPDLVFEIQADGSIAATQIGLNAVLIYTHSGSTVTGLSGVELDTTSDVPAADPSNQLTIRGLADRPDNELATANSVVEVTINNHTYGYGATGI